MTTYSLWLTTPGTFFVTVFAANRILPYFCPSRPSFLHSVTGFGPSAQQGSEFLLSQCGPDLDIQFIIHFSGLVCQTCVADMSLHNQPYTSRLDIVLTLPFYIASSKCRDGHELELLRVVTDETDHGGVQTDYSSLRDKMDVVPRRR